MTEKGYFGFVRFDFLICETILFYEKIVNRIMYPNAEFIDLFARLDVG